MYDVIEKSKRKREILLTKKSGDEEMDNLFINKTGDEECSIVNDNGRWIVVDDDFSTYMFLKNRPEKVEVLEGFKFFSKRN